VKEKINDRLILIVGMPGSGKTTLATHFALMQSKFIIVRSNYKINIPNYKSLEIEDLEKLNTSVLPNLIIFDEGYTLIESRRSAYSLNLYLSYKAFQSRKTLSRYIITAQLSGSLDNRFRELAGIVIKAKATEIGYFYQVYHNIERKGVRVLKKKKSWTLSYENAEKIYPYFKTREIVMSDKMKNIVVKNMKHETVITIARKYAEKMLKLNEKWSLVAIKAYLFEKNVSPEFAPAIYYCIQNEIRKNKQEKEKIEKQKKKQEAKQKRTQKRKELENKVKGNSKKDKEISIYYS